MSNKFEDALVSTLNDEVAITENGAIGFKTTGKSLLDLNFSLSSLRSKTEEEIIKAFSKAFFEDKMLSLKWLFMARDIRGGCGERRTFRVCFKWLAQTQPSIARALIGVVSEFGRWDDLWCLLDTDLAKDVTDLVFEQLSKDLDAKKAGKSISLLAKWLPSVNSSSSVTKSLAKKIRIALSMDEKTYRKTLSSLRAYSNVVEVATSANKWSSINYDVVPSLANLKYKNAFLKRDEVRRREWLEKLENGEAKINSSASFPSDIVHAYEKNYDYSSYGFKLDLTLEEMWKALSNIAINGNVLAVCDGSGSMTTSVSGNLTALDVCHALGIYCAEHCTGPFNNKCITFSRRPQYIDMSNAKSLAEKLTIMHKHDEVENTNLEAVFDLVLETVKRHNLKQEDIPSLVILSDMEVDGGCDFGYVGHCWNYNSSDYNASKTALMEKIRQKWNSTGYVLPRLIWWNIASRTGTIPMQQNPETGMILCSGYSQSQFKMLASNKTDPYEVLVESLSVPRYDVIEKLCKELV